MNLSEFTYLLNKPDTINNQQISDIEGILKEYPYFQSARSLHLKGLYNQDSFKYNTALKTTATYTADREVLFNFITSEEFISIQKNVFESKENDLKSIEISEDLIAKTETVTAEKAVINKIEESIQSSIEMASKPQIQTQRTVET